MKLWHRLSWRWKERVKMSAFVAFLMGGLGGAQLIAGPSPVRCVQSEATHDRG